jgi:phosphatidate cytidylyltransferase
MQNKKKTGFNFKRVVIAAVVLPLVIAYIYYLPPMYYLGLLVVVAVLAMREFYVMYKVPVHLYLPGVVIGGVILYLACRYPYYVPGGIAGAFLLFLMIRLFTGKTPSGSMAEIGPLWTGLFYIPGFLSFQWLLRSRTDGAAYVLLLYFSVWLADSMAYYIGKYLGRNKLFPSVSPNKTLEGALGSLLGGIGGAFIAKSTLDVPEISVAGALMAGAVIGISTLIGDLIESMFKRDAGVKDSSGFIPGHGGLLDKIDGLLVSGPVFYVLVRYL